MNNNIITKDAQEGSSNMYRKTCPNCQVLFSTNNKRKKFCTDQCRKRNHDKNNSPKRKCRHCNRDYRSYSEKEYCTAECRVEQRTKVMLIKRLNYLLTLRKVCLFCKEMFTATNARQVYCNVRCKDNVKNNKRKVHFQHECRECGKPYTDTIKDSAGCGDECKRKYRNRKSYYERQHIISSNGNVDWSISISRLIKRDGINCYICNDPVNLNDYKLSREEHFIAGNYYPSIDHVIPISKGGTHTWDNVKLAHRICNTIKSND